MNRQVRGFTLIELLVTLVVSLILIAVGLPGMGTVIKNNRLTTTSNQMITDLSKARNEAIKRGRRVTLCPTTNDFSACSGNQWENGWIAFVDNDKDNTADSGEEIILKRSARKSVTIGGTSDLVSSACFSPRGVVCNAGSFDICDSRNDRTTARKVVISRTGRTRVETDADSCP